MSPAWLPWSLGPFKTYSLRYPLLIRPSDIVSPSICKYKMIQNQKLFFSPFHLSVRHRTTLGPFIMPIHYAHSLDIEQSIGYYLFRFLLVYSGFVGFDVFFCYYFSDLISFFIVEFWISVWIFLVNMLLIMNRVLFFSSHGVYMDNGKALFALRRNEANHGYLLGDSLR